MHDGASQEPAVEKTNSTVMVELPDKLSQSVIDRIKTFVLFVVHACNRETVLTRASSCEYKQYSHG